MSLGPLLVVEQDDDGGDEVNDLAGWEEVNVGSAVPATVTIATGSQGATRKHMGILYRPPF